MSLKLLVEDEAHSAAVKLLFSGIESDSIGDESTQLKEDVKAAAENAQRMKEKDIILKKIGEVGDFVNAIGEYLKDVSAKLGLKCLFNH